MATDLFDVIVVGGGYPGCSIAYHVAKAGLRTILLEQREIASGASGANFGCVQVQDANLGQSLDLTLRSFGRVMDFERELGLDLGIGYTGSLIGAADPVEMAELETLYQGKKAAGLDIKLLGRAAIRDLEPALNAEALLGATYFVQGRLDPFRLLYGFLKRGRESGLVIREHTAVRGFDMMAGRVCGVVTSTGGIIRGRVVVVAAGAWTKELCLQAGILVPIEYVWAEGLVSEQLPATLRNYYSSAGFFTAAHDQEQPGMSLCICQTSHGNLLIGETSSPARGTPEKTGSTSARHCRGIARDLRRFYPDLVEVNALRTWRTPSPFTASMEPVIGPVGPPGLIVAAGFKSCAVMTAMAGEIVATLVSGRKLDIDLSPYTSQVQPLGGIQVPS